MIYVFSWIKWAIFCLNFFRNFFLSPIEFRYIRYSCLSVTTEIFKIPVEKTLVLTMYICTLHKLSYEVTDLYIFAQVMGLKSWILYWTQCVVTKVDTEHEHCMLTWLMIFFFWKIRLPGFVLISKRIELHPYKREERCLIRQPAVWDYWKPSANYSRNNVRSLNS